MVLLQERVIEKASLKHHYHGPKSRNQRVSYSILTKDTNKSRVLRDYVI